LLGKEIKILKVGFLMFRLLKETILLSHTSWNVGIVQQIAMKGGCFI
jgi:hypothetical protein